MGLDEAVEETHQLSAMPHACGFPTPCSTLHFPPITQMCLHAHALFHASKSSVCTGRKSAKTLVWGAAFADRLRRVYTMQVSRIAPCPALDTTSPSPVPATPDGTEKRQAIAAKYVFQHWEALDFWRFLSIFN